MKIFSKFKQLKKDAKIVIITALLASCVGVYATGECIISATADDVSYNNTSVQAAIDELFAMSENYCPPGYECTKIPAIIQPTPLDDDTTFRNYEYRRKIKTITLDDEINEPENVIESWDIGVHQNGDVMAYITQNTNDNTMYDLYIQGKGSLYANPDSSYLFSYFDYLEEINGLDKLNTSMVTNMSHMFTCIMVQELDLSAFDTSNVTSMEGMFASTDDYHAFSEKPLDLSSFDTSNVTNMSHMFSSNYGIVEIVLDEFDTSKVTDMSYMFWFTGYATDFTIDFLDKFDTSNVTNMEGMFAGLTTDNLDLGENFDTSNVTNMSSMFWKTGIHRTSLSINFGNKFDTSNVTNMNSMFYRTAYNATSFSLDLGNKFDTSNVTNMDSMFREAGYNATSFTLDLGDKFYTSNVTNMYTMFDYTGYKNNNLELDLSTFDFSNVTSYTNIFRGMTSTKKIYVGNSTARNWIINNSGNSNLTTSNVLIKS